MAGSPFTYVVVIIMRKGGRLVFYPYIQDYCSWLVEIELLDNRIIDDHQIPHGLGFD